MEFLTSARQTPSAMDLPSMLFMKLDLKVFLAQTLTRNEAILDHVLNMDR